MRGAPGTRGWTRMGEGRPQGGAGGGSAGRKSWRVYGPWGRVRRSLTLIGAAGGGILSVGVADGRRRAARSIGGGP